MHVTRKTFMFLAVVFCGMAAWAGPDADKIKADYPKCKQDKMQGFDRIVFDFEGCEAWLVEPAKPAADGRWVWCMEWPTAFQDRVGVRELLQAGYRFVAFNPAFVGILDAAHKKLPAGNQSDEMIARRGRLQAYFVRRLNLAPKCGLIGMSWGGFYSVRYASTRPQDVAAIYLDAPLLDFTTLNGYKTNGYKSLHTFYDFATADYVGKDDPFQSVNRAEPIARAKIPILCIYGGNDTVVPAPKNILRFAEAFEKAGGTLKLWRENTRGHHPHGLDKGEQQVFVNFFDKAFAPARPASKK